ncbi:SRPBCC domain-containing protein [Actinocrinis puniceicyclus]|uniref:SRPBCC domain-containing protein n=1 Tax=Actinocrinis puniceicyclus TaxID=977794 RepID=A0A8J7WQK7_9ACTN|nr:SRPBCC domain-containing protein [Actinocrinis puniceicyclus]MBS2966673.1 SRPBCC domain-containing protein [Actinocrinis puniceicyclus]
MDESHVSPPPPEPAAQPAPQGDESDARLVAVGTRPAIRFERVLDAGPRELWRALTEPEGLRGWFPCSVTAQRWEVGGALTFAFPGRAEFTTEGVVLECEPPRTLAYLWGEETLRFELTPLGLDAACGTRTRLVVLDELFAPVAARNAAGWHVCLDRLARRAPPQNEQGGADETWQRLFARYRAAFEPVLGPQDGPPADRGEDSGDAAGAGREQDRG